jgi:alpha-glucosidase (family GH31 glycosyl hydrolase)
MYLLLMRLFVCAQVWAGASAWPDFFNPEGIQFWSEHIASFRTTVPAAGLWLDMNEVRCSDQASAC